MKTIASFVLLLIALLIALLIPCRADHTLGWKSNPNHASGLRQFVHHPLYSATALPTVVDLSGVMPNGPAAPLAIHNPAIYDQGQEGSCTANAAARCMEFAWHLKHGNFISASRQGLYTCELIHDGDWPQDSGSYTATALWVLTQQGVGTESLFPYEQPFTIKPTKAYLTDALTHQAMHAYDVASSDHISIKVALSKGFPVMFGGSVYRAIESLDSSNYFNSPHSGRSIGGHERTIVGYNTTLRHVYPNGKSVTGFYWVANSWGDSWGYKGYSWEPMSDIENASLNNDFAVVDLTE